MPGQVLPSVIGRDDELARIPELLASHRLVCLTGAPGAGKTLLALAVGRRAAGLFPDGAGLVRLDAVADPECVESIVMASLGVSDHPGRPAVESLTLALRDRQGLLVLDNCEHVIDECVRIVEVLLAECPRLRVLATSRESLNIPLEQVFEVRPLRVPLEDTLEAVAGSSAGRLLIARAVAADADFTLGEADAAQAARICRALDGLPLAIELAASRLRVFGLAQIADRLDRRLDLLTGRRQAPRHRSLRATLDWSHELLDAPERWLLARLSVFLGSFTLEAAEVVAADDDLPAEDVLDALANLAESSLVTVQMAETEPGAVRYRLLEVIRQYAGERLSESGEAETMRARHAHYFCEFAERTSGVEEIVRRQVRLSDQYPNIRAAMTWAAEHREAELCLRYLAAMAWYWKHHATGEGVAWSREVLDDIAEAPPELLRRSLLAAGSLFLSASAELAERCLRRAFDLAENAGDEAAEIEACRQLVWAGVQLDDAPGVDRWAARALDLARRHGDHGTLAEALVTHGLGHAYCGDPGDLDQNMAEALAIRQEHGDPRGMDTVRIAWAQAGLVLDRADTVREVLQAVPQWSPMDLAPAEAAMYWLCRGWLSPDEALPNVCKAINEIMSPEVTAYDAQRILGLGLYLTAAHALGQGRAADAVVLLQAGGPDITDQGKAPRRPPAPRWVDGLRDRALYDLSPDDRRHAEARGSGLSVGAALRLAGLPIPSSWD